MSETQTFDFRGSREKLDAIRPILFAMDASTVRQFNLSVPTAVSYAMKTYKSFICDKARFVETFKTAAFNPDAYNDFPTRVGALWHADIMLAQAIDPAGNVSTLIEASKPLYKKMGKAAVYLFGDHETLGQVVASIREGSGHMDQADDFARYAALFKENGAAAEGKCDVTKEDIETALDYSAQILNAMTDTEESSVSDLRDIRNRAGEYLRRAVDDIRDAALYIFRYDDDVQERYPSIYAGVYLKGRKKGKKASAESTAIETESDDTTASDDSAPAQSA